MSCLAAMCNASVVIDRWKRLESWLRRLPGKARRLIALAGYACDRVPITEFSEYEGLLAHATSSLTAARAVLRGVRRCLWLRQG